MSAPIAESFGLGAGVSRFQAEREILADDRRRLVALVGRREGKRRETCGAQQAGKLAADMNITAVGSLKLGVTPDGR